MWQHTDIQWCDSSVNPTTGCDGCELWNKAAGVRLCYSGPYHEGRLHSSMPHLYDAAFENVRLVPGRTAKSASWPDLRGKSRPDKPWLDGMPRLIFVGDMGDIFSKDVPFEYLEAELIDVAESKPGRRHVWLTLTKQSRRMAEFSWWLAAKGRAWPANVWPGVSVTSQATVKRIKYLLTIPATVSFVSAEPLKEAIDLRPYLARWHSSRCPLDAQCQWGGPECPQCGYPSGKLGWAIIGGASGPNAWPFDLAWARSLIGQCKAAGVPVFMKQVGVNPFDSKGPGIGYCAANMLDRLRDPKGGDPAAWPTDLRIRELPRVAQSAGGMR